MSLSCVFSSRKVQTFGHLDASYTSLWQDCLRSEPGKRPLPALAAPSQQPDEEWERAVPGGGGGLSCRLFSDQGGSLREREPAGSGGLQLCPVVGWDLCAPTQNNGFSCFTEMSILYFRRSLSWSMTFLKNSFLRREILWKNFW